MDTKRPNGAIPLGRFALCCRDVRWLAGLEMLLFGTHPIRKPLLYPSELRGHNGLAFGGYLVGYLSPTQPHRFSHHDVVTDARVTLRGFDRGMS